MHFEFKTLLVNTPRGSSDNSKKSKIWLGACKNGNPHFSDLVSRRIKELNEDKYFSGSTLIPIPRSSPIVDGALFPSKVIAERLMANGIGNNVSLCLKRTKNIPKSSTQFTAEARNSVQTHLDSLDVDNELVLDPTLILIDDVFTLGRTAMASAIKLQKMYPEKEIKIFCPFRTRSLSEYDRFELVDGGIMTLSPYGKVILPD